MKQFILLCILARYFVIVQPALIGEENFSVAPIQSKKNKLDGKVVNGQAAAVGQFPHQALLLIQKTDGYYRCGGCLISSLWVLTAAHCLEGQISVQISLGSIKANSMPVQQDAVEVQTTGKYVLGSHQDDIALLKMKSAVTFDSNVQPINLPTRSQANQSFVNDLLIISGFGKTSTGDNADNLQFTNVKGIKNVDCKKKYSFSISPSILCTNGSPNKNQAACRGDSGGPLIQVIANNSPTLVGLSSWGPTDCASGFPEGYTRVGFYLDWIQLKTGIAIKI